MAALTVKMAAERLGFSTDTIYSMLNQGQLGCIRRPNCAIRITENHINNYEEQFECHALSDQNQTSNLSKSKVAATSMSGTVNRAAAVAKSKAQGSHLRTV